MESIDEFKRTDFENFTCFYFDNIMRIVDTDFDNISLDKKSYISYESILIYDIP